MGEPYKIGDLAREFDVTLRTLRFYEDRGILDPQRSGSTRLYSETDRSRLQIALFCKRIGLSLAEIGQVMELFEKAPTDLDVRRKLKSIYHNQLHPLRDEKNKMDETIADLQHKLDELDSRQYPQ